MLMSISNVFSVMEDKFVIEIAMMYSCFDLPFMISRVFGY